MPSMILCGAERDEVTEDGIPSACRRLLCQNPHRPELGPVFARAIPGEWQPHLDKMYAFWSSVMLTTGRYKGNPVAKHLAVDGIELKLFERWLALFDETCSEQFDDRISAEFHAKADRIAESLKLALFYRPDRPWPPAA